MQELHAVFSGRVQGVFFRANTEKVARSMGAAGYVKNLPDGRVEAVFQGEPMLLSRIVDAVVKGQNTLVRVDGVDAQMRDARASFCDFVILR